MSDSGRAREREKGELEGQERLATEERKRHEHKDGERERLPCRGRKRLPGEQESEQARAAVLYGLSPATWFSVMHNVLVLHRGGICCRLAP